MYCIRLQFLFSGSFHCVAKYFVEMSSVFVMALRLIPYFSVPVCWLVTLWYKARLFSTERGTNRVTFTFY